MASLLGVCQEVTYEGQAAVELEHLARTGSPVTLDFAVAEGVLDPTPVIAGLVEGLRAGAGIADLAAGFHATVIRATAAAAADRARAAGISVIGLTGGVSPIDFCCRTSGRAHRGRLRVLSHRTVPCNDGGLALGQATIATAILTKADAAAEPERSGVCASGSPAR